MALSMSNSPELTQEEVYPFLIQPLQAASVVLAQSVRTIDSPTGDPLRIPKLVPGNNAGWYAENEQIGEVDPDFSELTLLPTNLKSVKVIHRFSNELARHAVLPISSTLQAALVAKVARTLDDEFLNGDGTADGNGNRAVIGLWNQANIQTGSFDDASASSTVDSVATNLGKLMTAEITDFSNTVWFMNTAAYVKLLKVKTTDSRALLVPDLNKPGSFSLGGIKVVPTTKLAAGRSLLVDFNQVVIARDLAPQVTFLNERYADYDQKAIRVVARMDIGLLNAAGVVAITDATP
jgi:HK97 family phage major capsid protein